MRLFQLINRLFLCRCHPFNLKTLIPISNHSGTSIVNSTMACVNDQSASCETLDHGHTSLVSTSEMSKTSVVDVEAEVDSSKLEVITGKTDANDQSETGWTLSRRARRRMQRNKMMKSEKCKKQKKPRPDRGFDGNYFKETEYFFENGLRKVQPYYFTFKTHAKGRWLTRSLMEVLISEFRLDTPETYRKGVESGKIKVNGQTVSADYIIKNNDFVTNTIHRHESSVTSDPIQILEQTDDVVVVNKPSSIPVHPCGKYRHNTVVFILGKEHNLTNLRTIYRLDRLTSGVLMFTRTHEKTQEMMQNMRNGSIKKTYLCRVEGEFPSGIIECREPLAVMSHKVGMFKVSPEGKESWTTFERISFNGKSSIVKCQPHTGRTHQIRIHLQFLGHPIVNDTLYNTEAWGPSRGKGGVFDKTEEQLIEDIIKLHNKENYIEPIDVLSSSLETNTEDDSCVNNSSATSNEDRNVALDLVKDKSAERTIPIDKNSLSDDKTVSSSNNTEGDNRTTQPQHQKEESCKSRTIEITNLSNNENVTEESDLDGKNVDVLGKSSSQNEESHDKSPESKTDSFVASHNNDDSDIGHPPHKKIKLDETAEQISGGHKVVVDKDCQECQANYKDPTPEDLVMYLHALSYEGPGWKYSTELPHWASDSWKEEQ